MGSDLDQLTRIISTSEFNNGVHGILMVKCGVLVLRRTDGQYSTITIEDGHLQYDYQWLDEEGIKQKCMALNPEEYKMAESIYGD